MILKRYIVLIILLLAFGFSIYFFIGKDSIAAQKVQTTILLNPYTIFEYSNKSWVRVNRNYLNDYNWKETGIVYWQGKPIKRDSIEYDQLIDELYISAIQNEFYRNAIKNCKLPIIHAMGAKEKRDTVFTRNEFEFMLNCLHDFLNR